MRHHRRQPTRLPIPGILQARTLEWVAISFSNAWKWKVKAKPLSGVQLLATPWTAARQVSLTLTISGNLLKAMSTAEKSMATHFSTLAWKIPWMEEPGRSLVKTWLSDWTITVNKIRLTVGNLRLTEVGHTVLLSTSSSLPTLHKKNPEFLLYQH